MESVYGGTGSAEITEGEVVEASADAPAVKAAPAPADPAKVAAVKSAVGDLQAHTVARAAQHPDLQEEAAELVGILKSLAKRFEEDGLGASAVGHVSDTEARLVDGLVKRLTNGRDHRELAYLRELADSLTYSVLALGV